jgi:hypothetical protein
MSISYIHQIPAIKVVTLDNFYESIEHPLAGKTFTDMVTMRTRGYGPEYPKSFLTVDQADYVARHHVFYIKKNGEYVPFGCYKQVPFSACTYYKVKFTPQEFVKSAGSLPHEQAMAAIFEKSRKEKREVIYGGGLTLEKEFRKDHPISGSIHELIAALLYLDALDFNHPIGLGMAVPRFKIDQFFEKVGYRRVQHFNQPLGPLPIVVAGNEPTVFLESDEMSPWAKSCFEKYRHVIESREIIAPLESMQEAKAA